MVPCAAFNKTWSPKTLWTSTFSQRTCLEIIRSTLDSYYAGQRVLSGHNSSVGQETSNFCHQASNYTSINCSLIARFTHLSKLEIVDSMRCQYIELSRSPQAKTFNNNQTNKQRSYFCVSGICEGLGHPCLSNNPTFTYCCSLEFQMKQILYSWGYQWNWSPFGYQRIVEFWLWLVNLLTSSCSKKRRGNKGGANILYA